MSGIGFFANSGGGVPVNPRTSTDYIDQPAGSINGSANVYFDAEANQWRRVPPRPQGSREAEEVLLELQRIRFALSVLADLPDLDKWTP